MLKRLLIAVFVLSLVTALSGTAFSDVYWNNDLGTALPTVDQNAPKYGASLKSISALQPASRPETDIEALPFGATIPAPPLLSFCLDLEFDNGAAVFSRLYPSGVGDRDFMNVRYTADENFSCTLYYFWVLPYAPAMVGTPDLMCYLWDDDGFGNPGTALDSFLIPNADLVTYSWKGVDFSPTSPNAPAGGWVFSDGEEYHYGVSVRGVAGDTLAVLLDDGSSASGRTSFYDVGGTTWVTYLAAYGNDRAMVQSSEYCAGEIPFTDCYSQNYFANLSYLFDIPDYVYANTAYATRFDVGGPETLVSVDVVLYNAGQPDFGVDDVYVTVYGDNAGVPDEGNILWTGTFLAGSYVHGYNTMPIDIVVDATFHVGISSSATPGVGSQLIVVDDGTSGNNRSSTFLSGGGGWVSTLSDWGADYEVVMYANLCRDQFSSCKVQSWTDGAASFWGIGNAFRESAAVRMSADGQNCQVNEVGWAFYDPGDPQAYTHDTKVSVYTDAAGYPGTELASIIVTPMDYTFYPATHVVDFHPLDVYVSGDYWIVAEALDNPTNDSGIYILSDDGSGAHGSRSAASFVNVDPLGVWELMADHYGDDYGWVAFSSHCCIPFDDVPRVCDPMADAGWSTLQGNQQRTGASNLAVGDAWCNLNLNWNYQDATQGITFTGPTIYGDKAVCAFGTKYIVFDIITGTPLYTLTSTTGDGFLIGNSISVAPTIANIGGTDMMFIGGGSTLGFGAIDFNTGAVIWQNTLMSGAGIVGKTSYTTATVLNDGVIDVVYHTTDNGFVVALEAATGAYYSGWATNPVSVTSHCFISGATDGTSLFYSTQDAGTEGDMYSIDAATGTINWTLSGAGGLAAPGEAGYVYPEGFRGGMAYADGVLYAVSWANDGGISPHPIDGFLYQVDAATGNHFLPPTATNRADYSSPLVDQNAVYVATLSQWVTPTAGGNIVAYHRTSGSLLWTATTQDNAKYYTSGLLTCEPDAVGAPAPDLMFVFNDAGFFECYETTTGDQLFSRRVEHDGGGAEIGMAGALAMTATDGLHMLASDFGGGLYDLTLGADRPRLEMQMFNKKVPVEFGGNPALPLNLGPVIVNTGCVDLNITSTAVDEASITVVAYPNFVSADYVPQDAMLRASAIADAMQREAFLSKFNMPEQGLLTSPDASFAIDVQNTEKSSNRYSAGIPAWFVSLDQPIAGDIIAPGDSMDLLITVNQPLISRGPQNVFIAFGSDDPDYFLNNDATLAGKLPELALTIVGGCLIDTTTLTFGMGGANTQLVTNTGRLGTGDWTPHGYEIDGDGGSFYQGAYVYGVDTFRVATNSQDWLSGGTFDGELGAWFGLQADPNYCDNSCKPALTSGVAVGAMSIDGITYDPIVADMVCKTFIDSVTSAGRTVDGTIGSFGWSDFANLNFDDTLTMGLMVHSRTFGVTDVPELANLTLEIFDFNERNGDSVVNWYFGQITDYDVGGDDGAMDQSISTAWAFNPGGDDAWGHFKIPFGCGEVGPGQDFEYTPIRSIKVLDGAEALFSQPGGSFNNGAGYWDSAYMWLSQPFGTVAPPQAQNSDFEMASSIVKHDFEGNGTYSFGVANFAFIDALADNTSGAEMADMANFVNKWAGFGRGDVNNDGGINLADIIYLAGNINNGGPGAIPFAHLGDVNADGSIDAGDINYLVDYYFNCGPCPSGDWMF